MICHINNQTYRFLYWILFNANEIVKKTMKLVWFDKGYEFYYRNTFSFIELIEVKRILRGCGKDHSQINLRIWTAQSFAFNAI